MPVGALRAGLDVQARGRPGGAERAQVVARPAHPLQGFHGTRRVPVPLLERARSWPAGPGGGDRAKLRHLLLRAGAAGGHRPDRGDGPRTRPRRQAAGRSAGRTGGADTHARMEARIDRRQVARRRDADHRHRAGLRADDAAATRRHDRADRLGPRGRSAAGDRGRERRRAPARAAFPGAQDRRVGVEDGSPRNGRGRQQQAGNRLPLCDQGTGARARGQDRDLASRQDFQERERNRPAQEPRASLARAGPCAVRRLRAGGQAALRDLRGGGAWRGGLFGRGPHRAGHSARSAASGSAGSRRGRPPGLGRSAPPAGAERGGPRPWPASRQPAQAFPWVAGWPC